MTRVQCYTIAIRAINQKMGTVKRRKVRLALARARDFLANDPVLAPHDADCPSRDGFYPENCECSHAKFRTSERVPREELTK